MESLKAYNPRQPRFPKGHPQGGQWKSKISGRVMDRLMMTRGRMNVTSLVDFHQGHFTNSLAGKTRDSLRTIDLVHKVKGLPRIIVQTVQNPSLPWSGAYFFNKGRIVIASGSPHPGMTTAHEMGHFFDHKDFKKYEGKRGWSSEGPQFAAWRNAVEASPTIKEWRKREKDGFARIGPIKVRVEPSASRYYLSPREMWARSYAQYIATKSRNRSMLRELRGLQEDYLRTQWSDKEFAPIAAEIERLLRQQGWQ